MSAEAIVPVTPEQATALAEAVVDLGPDADADVTDAAVAEVMELEITDAIVGDLGWSVSTPLEEAWADARRAPLPRRWRQRVWISILRWRTPQDCAPRQEQRDGWGRGWS